MPTQEYQVEANWLCARVYNDGCKVTRDLVCSYSQESYYVADIIIKKLHIASIHLKERLVSLCVLRNHSYSHGKDSLHHLYGLLHTQMIPYNGNIN